MGNADSKKEHPNDPLDRRELFRSFADPPKRESKPHVRQFKVLQQKDFLPRYKYHRFLLDWFISGLQEIQDFPQSQFKECPVIVGEEINNKNLSILFGENTDGSKVPQREIEKDEFVGADVLVVYFLNKDTGSVCQNIADFFSHSSVEKSTILFVMHDDGFIDESHKAILEERWNCKFVVKHRLEVITQMTYILERRLLSVLEQAQGNLYTMPLTENVHTSLLEVNAILRRLKQAAYFPNLFPEKIEDFPRRRIDDMLESFGDKIVWHGFDGDTLHIITTDVSVQTVMERILSKPEFENMRYSITVQDELSVQLLANIGVPLHGAKFVYVDNGRSAFLQDEKFATTGSVMKCNDSSMAVVTTRHAFSNQENIFVLIDKSVVRLGQMTINSQHTKERLCEDITLVDVESDAVSIVNKNCEKLLIGATGLPTPGRISLRELKVGDIVHKRGARTGLTTGIVTSVQISKLGGYQVESRVIQICGRGFEPFAAEGDSGSLVFQHPLSPDETVLDVLAMVQSKLNVPVRNAPIVCFPLTKGCETLHKIMPGLQSLQFF